MFCNHSQTSLHVQRSTNHPPPVCDDPPFQPPTGDGLVLFMRKNIVKLGKWRERLQIRLQLIYSYSNSLCYSYSYSQSYSPNPRPRLLLLLLLLPLAPTASISTASTSSTSSSTTIPPVLVATVFCLGVSPEAEHKYIIAGVPKTPYCSALCFPGAIWPAYACVWCGWM